MKILVLDIGGTSIKAALWNGAELVDHREVPTQAHKGAAVVMKTAISLAEEYEGFSCIGIASAGQIDPVEGIVSFANPNIPDYTGTPLRQIFTDAFEVPVVVENDAYAAALGELAVKGKKPPPDDFLCLTYGTGIGGAIVIDRKLYRGTSFSAAEFGSLFTHGSARSKDLSQKSGWYESYASTTALVKMAREVDTTLINGRKVFQSMHRPEIKQVVDQWIEEIIIGLATVIYAFNPSAVVLGGGIMNEAYIIHQIREQLPKYLLPSFHKVQVLPARAGNSAGLLGVAWLASQTEKEK